jgi:hypothetical protein
LKAPLPENATRLYVSNNHWQNFFDCVGTRKLPICDVETGHRSATMCHLGAISLRTGRKLMWDSAAEKFVGENAAEANGYRSRNAETVRLLVRQLKRIKLKCTPPTFGNTAE